MKLLDKNGRPTVIPHPTKYIIDWSKDSRSKFQNRVKEFLKSYWKTDFVFEEFPVPKTRLSLDFFNKTRMVAIEVQGGQHLGYNKHFHGGNRYKFLTQLKRDQEKERFCEDFGILLIQVYPDDIIDKELFLKFGVDL